MCKKCEESMVLWLRDWDCHSVKMASSPSLTQVSVLEKISSLLHKPSIHPAIKGYLTVISGVWNLLENISKP